MLSAISDPDTHAAEDHALVRLLGSLEKTGYKFTTVSPSTHARVIARPGRETARNLTDVFGWSLPFDERMIPGPILALMRDADIAMRHENGLWRSRVRVSSLAGRLFVHSAYPTVAADSVFFGPDTYRFARALSDGIARRSGPIARAVDIGCGAGPGAIVVADLAPDAEVLMVDINEGALRLARVNAAAAGAERAVARRSDLLSAVDGEFDLIVSNPPYLNDPLQRAYRHGGGRHGEALSLRILDAALERLAPAGTLILYTGVAIVGGEDAFLSAATERLAGHRLTWSYEEIDPDVFGDELDAPAYVEAERIAAVVLTVTQGS